MRAGGFVLYVVSAGCLLGVSPRSMCHTCVPTQPALRQKAVGARADALF